jgi:outer membrane protein TolC
MLYIAIKPWRLAIGFIFEAIRTDNLHLHAKMMFHLAYFSIVARTQDNKTQRLKNFMTIMRGNQPSPPNLNRTTLDDNLSIVLLELQRRVQQILATISVGPKYPMIHIRRRMQTNVILFFGVPLLLAAVKITALGQEKADDQVSLSVTLQESLALAMKDNPNAVAAKQQYLEAVAALGEATAARRLQITFNSTGSYSNAAIDRPPPAEENFGTVQNSISVPLPIGAKPGLLVTEAQHQQEMAHAQLDLFQQNLARSVASAYYNLLLQQLLLSAANDSLQTATREESDTKNRNTAGEAPTLDVMQATVRTASAQTEDLRVQQAVTVAQEAFNDLMGVPIDEMVTVQMQTAQPAAPLMSLSDARLAALKNSPDLKAALEATASEQAVLEATKRYNDPQVSIQALDARSGDVTSFSRQDSLQASVTVPIDDGGVGHEQIKSAAATLAQAIAAEESVRKSVLLATSSDYVAVQGSLALVELTSAARDLAQATYEKTLLGYQSGLYPLSDTLAAQSALAQARTDYAQAVVSAASAAFSLHMDIDGDNVIAGAGQVTATPGSSLH